MVSNQSAYKIIGISGSLRNDSTNTSLIRAAAALAPKDRVASFDIVTYKDVPVYDGDVEDKTGIPETVLEIAGKIEMADGVYICTPEYNYSTSGALKNLIDWLSRCKNKPLEQKPCAVAGCCAGPSGGMRATYDLRKILIFLQPHVMSLPELHVDANYLKFDKSSPPVLVDETVIKSTQKHIEAFVDHIDWVKKAQRI